MEKKSLWIDSKIHKKLKKKAVEEDTYIEKIASDFLKSKLEEEDDALE